MPLTAESIEIERAFLPRKPVSVDNGRREKLPLQSIPITIDQNNTEFVNSTAKNEVNQLVVSCIYKSFKVILG
jgi:hypothetical protein